MNALRTVLVLTALTMWTACKSAGDEKNAAPSAAVPDGMMMLLLDASMGVVPKTDVTQWFEAEVGKSGAGLKKRVELTATFESAALHDMADPERGVRVLRMIQILFVIQDDAEHPVQTVVVELDKPGLVITDSITASMEREAILESLQKYPLPALATGDGGS